MLDHLFLYFRAVETGVDRVIAICQHPIGQQGAQGSAAGGIGVLVNGHVMTGGAGFFHELNRFFASAPVLLTAYFEVRNFDGYIGFDADVDRFADGGNNAVAFAADVAGIDTVEASCYFGQSYHFFCVGIGAGYVDESGRKTYCAIVHRIGNDFFHALHF